jgi:Rrf2 family protein
MKGSAKGRYGLQFMVGLALETKPGPALVETIALRQHLPPKFLRVLLGHLKTAGLVKVQRGPNGGCELAKPPHRITVLEIVEALDGRLGATDPDPHASPSARAVRELWHSSTEAARSVLHAATLADLVERQKALEADSHGYSI